MRGVSFLEAAIVTGDAVVVVVVTLSGRGGEIQSFVCAGQKFAESGPWLPAGCRLEAPELGGLHSRWVGLLTRARQQGSAAVGQGPEL